MHSDTALDRSSRNPRWDTAILAITSSVLVAPVAVDLATSPRYRPFGYIAADTCYYLSVARNIVELGSVSMDGQHATNGFHPLWQLCTVAIYGVCKLLHVVEHCVLASVVASLLCVLSAVWILGRAYQRGTGSIPFVFITLPIGVYSILLSYYWLASWRQLAAQGGALGPAPLFGTLYAYSSGMESGAVLLAFAVTAFAFVRFSRGTSRRSGLACGGALAFLCFARLDHGAFAVFPLTVWALHAIHAPARRRFAVSAIAVFVLPLVAYLAMNLAYVGVALPVSGTGKTSFPLPTTGAVSAILDIVRDPLAPHNPWTVMRALPIALPSVAALLWLAVFLRVRVGSKLLGVEVRPFATAFDLFLLQMTPGVLLLAVYSLLFVYLPQIGHWYFPVSTLYVSLVAYRLLSIVVAKIPTLHGWPKLVALSRTAVVVALAAWVVLGFLRYQRRPDYMKSFARMYWEVGPKVRRTLKNDVPKLLEWDDGIVGLSLGVPAMSGLRLAIDDEASKVAAAGHLADLAVSRGFGALTTFYYSDHLLTTKSSGADAMAWAQRLTGERLTDLKASVLYGDDLLTIVQMSSLHPTGERQ
jgi:hypothetical protein